MNEMMNVKHTIKSLLESNVTSYQIEKVTGVSRAKIGRLRNGKNKIDDLTLDTAEKLHNYQKGLDRMDELKNKIVEVENPNNIVEYESLSRYYIDIINNQDSTFEVEYAEVAKVEHDNGNEYYTVELNSVEEIKFTDEIKETVDLENFFARFENEDQKGETITETFFFHNLEDATDYAKLVLEGNDTFEDCAKKVGIIE
ncbi:hypothetical protein [Staphylococcus hyicus]|uniref:Uncharacterized protein n=1 Tax=Staphylococcus hyicus TaxID=1284 RepID=A0ACD5FKN6_STAHY|nr:hypothetical protein [Staphylococcus hyicus]MDP4447528.1 hypothetical protein [Staphylococcus hyicus]MDP4460436.1 hypothetical protein [Staphylococcus hyicus]MDP4463450.1 hypothetical protein [Staphylococcus hyicus]